MGFEVAVVKKRILITGASSGIGEEYAKQYASKNCDLILVARREDRLIKLKNTLQKNGVSVQVIAGDLAKLGEVKRIFCEAELLGPIHGVINNAGVGHYGPFFEYTAHEQLQMIDLNVRALVELSHYAVKHMKAHGQDSFIINVSSIAAFQAVANFAVYSASKSFVRAFSETLYLELKESNIMVSCVSPGGTYTEFLEHAGQELTPSAEKMMMSSSDVVSLSIVGLEQKKAQVIPGKMNKMVAFLPRLLPYQSALSIFSMVMENSVKRKKRKTI